MQLRCWLATALGAGFLLYGAPFAVAQNSPTLPQPCVDAGVTAKAACDALLAARWPDKDQPDAAKAAAAKAAAEKKAAAKAAADQAAAEKNAAAKAAADRAAADKAAVAKAASDQAAAEKNAAAKAAADKVAAEKAAAVKAAADQDSANKAAAAKAAADQAAANKAAATKAAATKAGQLPPSCVNSGVTTKAECDALLAKANDGVGKAAADRAAADKAAKDKAAADKAAAKTQPAVAVPTDKTNNKLQPVALSKECIDADMKNQEQCDASLAIAGQKAKTEPTIAAPSRNLPVAVTPAKSAAEKPVQQPAAPVLPDITSGLNAATKTYNGGVAALDKAGPDNAAAGKARTTIKSAQDEIDKLCKSNRYESTGQCLAQYAILLSPLPAAAGSGPVAAAPMQPVEMINNLPKGVTQKDVAPLLDSAKDQKAGKVPTELATQKATPSPQNVKQAELNAAVPETDKAAQGSLKRQKVTPIDQQKGEQLGQTAAPQIQVPQNVTIINQTLVNNNTTNNSTINNAMTGNTTTNNPRGSENPANVNRGSQERQLYGSRRSDNPIGLGLGIVLQFNNQLIINSPARDQRRIAYNDQDRTSYERLPQDRYRETIRRQDGVTIVTNYNRNGDILRRSRFDNDGREIVIAYFDDSHATDLLQWRDPSEDLPPLRLRIAARDYVLDADEADESRVQLFFAQPPIERVYRIYSINEVKRSSRVCDMVRRLEIGNLTFDTGAATVSQDQVADLSKVATAMLRLLKRNPAETFLIEGHTDAVGSDVSNLELSDARAATIAQILTEFYRVPPENLATQGYGKRYLKVQTDSAEALNRRVTIRRITPLVTVSDY